MDVLLLWMCFLTVLVALGLAVGVLVREARRHLVARRQPASELQAAPDAPRAAQARESVHVPGSRPPSSSAEQRPRRGLGQLIPTLPATSIDGEASGGRGLGGLRPAAATAERGQDGRGLGQLLSGHPA